MIADRSLQSLFDWLFRNRRTGEITVVQIPNVALWIYVVTVVLRWLVPIDSAGRTVIDWIGVAALAWWAVGEVFWGVNPWRRMLGLGVSVIVVIGLVSLAG